ncbi:replication/maintenance protein RepL [Salmonella enterica]|nr:hypothetical protein [Salmonella enterica]ELG9706806.1 replication/maintenance protein RepL [Salmonella enterica]
MYLTDENKTKYKNAFYEEKKTTINTETGEVESESNLSLVRYNAEPPYVKMYIDDLCAIVNIPNSLKDILFLILRKLDYDGYITLSTRYRKLICENLKIKDGTLRNRLNLLVKNGFIISEGGNEYLANPNLFARGEWKTIIEQRASFELKIKYNENGRTIITEKAS